ncbi:MAG: hypothetical protein ACR2QR_07785 [Woeseiaceae bacterium]
MKNLILTSILLLPTLAGAQELLNIYCEECRDLTEYPEDARNFSYNQVLGTQGWLTPSQADRFQITDSHGNTVTIDMNLQFHTNPFTQIFGSLARHFIEFGSTGGLFVESLIVQIRVIYRNLDIVSYVFTTRDVIGDLPVGTGNTRQPPTSSGGGSGDDDDIDFNDASDYESDDTIDFDDFECEECTLQYIHPDGTLGEEYDLLTESEWEDISEL